MTRKAPSSSNANPKRTAQHWPVRVSPNSLIPGALFADATVRSSSTRQLLTGSRNWYPKAKRLKLL